MKNYIEVLEKIGQTKSIKQANKISEIYADVDCGEQAFKNILKKSGDLICALMPDDDDDDDE